MFEEDAEEYLYDRLDPKAIDSISEFSNKHVNEAIVSSFKDGAEFGYNKAKEELTERLENATEIIELMKDLFFACWQEKGLIAIKFEQRVNDFLKESE